MWYEWNATRHNTYYMVVGDPTVHVLENADKTVAHLLTRLGWFPSISQAKKNGFDRDFEEHQDFIKVGKHKRVWVIGYPSQYWKKVISRHASIYGKAPSKTRQMKLFLPPNPAN